MHYAVVMANPSRNTPPEPVTDPTPLEPVTDPTPLEPVPVSTTVTVTASLALAGLFARDETRTVELTPFIQGAIDSGKLVVQD